MGIFDKILPIAGGIAGGIFGGPGGAVAGYGAGGAISGAFKRDPKMPSLADVNLARDNPELWKQLQELKAMNFELDRQYAQRREGATAGEISQMGEARSQAYERQGNQGLIGSSTGAGLMGKQEAEMQNALQERIFRERQAMLQASMQGRQNYLGQLQGAQQNALAGMQGQVQNQIANDAARNQFYSGIFNAGAGMYGQQQYLDKMNDPNFAQGRYSLPVERPITQPGQLPYLGIPRGYSYSQNRNVT